MKPLWLVPAALAALTLSPLPASAQWAFKIGGGIGIQTGPLSHALNDGWNGQLGAAYKPLKKAVGLTFEWNNTYSGFSNELIRAFNIPGGHQNIWSLTMNVILSPPRKRYYKGANYYLIGGGGFYSRYAAVEGGSYAVPCYPYWYYACSGTVVIASRTDNAFGVNGGGGIGYNFGEGMLYVESRYHYAWTSGEDAQFVPIVLGFRFGW